jgi:hypothetical protein
MRYQSTTGLNHDDMIELAARVHEVLQCRQISLSRHRMGLFRQLEITLILLRQNMSQMVVADLFAVSQATVSRIYRRMCQLLEVVLAFTGITLAHALEQGHLVLVDGTFVPTGNRPASGLEKANYSGKHRLQCLSIQVACTARGDLVAVSDPVPGSRHDAAALQLCGWAEILNDTEARWIADTAYIATTAITPIKKRPGIERLDWEKAFNKQIASLRAPVEHAIAHLKNWKILTNGYRGRLQDLPHIISIITRLELLRQGW